MSLLLSKEERDWKLWWIQQSAKYEDGKIGKHSTLLCVLSNVIILQSVLCVPLLSWKGTYMFPNSGWKERLVSEWQAGLWCCQLPLESQNIVLVPMAEIFWPFFFFFTFYVSSFNDILQHIHKWNTAYTVTANKHKLIWDNICFIKVKCICSKSS